jgi:hypothetical protein
MKRCDKIHFKGRQTGVVDGEPMTYTICGIKIYYHKPHVTADLRNVTCKRCLTRLAKED